MFNGGQVYLGTSGSLRAAVLGVNDGLVSNFCLVMGIAGGTNNTAVVLLAGVAGLFAGAFSMAVGEYVSVRSQKDLFEYQIGLERATIESSPEDSREDLVEIYTSKGLSMEQAGTIADQIMSDPSITLDTLIRERLGLNPSHLGSPWSAAISSFGAFVAGALVPIIPYLLGSDNMVVLQSSLLSASSLILIGGTLSWMSKKKIIWGAARMACLGGLAALVTFGLGNIVGSSIASL